MDNKRNIENNFLNWEVTDYPKPDKRKAWVVLLSFSLILTLFITSIFITIGLSINHTLNLSSDLFKTMSVDVNPNAPEPNPTVMLDSNGNKFAEIYLQNTIPLKYEEIPLQAVHALVAAEDVNFWEHNGTSIPEFTKAVYQRIVDSDFYSDGSSITEQYVARLLTIEAETSQEIRQASSKTLEQRLSKAATAIKLEKELSKKQILTKYFNTAYFGNNVYGIGSAAAYYFSKEAKDLNLNEITVLIAILNNPENVNPIKNMDETLKYRSYVLERMVEERYITQSLKKQTERSEVILKITKQDVGCQASAYPFYCEHVKNLILSDPIYGETLEEREKVLYQRGLIIQTGLNPEVQTAADSVNQSAFPADSDFISVSATVKPGSGEVLALSSSKPYGQDVNETEIVYSTLDKYKMGNIFKPLIAAAALDEGWNITTEISAGNEYNSFTNLEKAETGSLNMGKAVNGGSDVWFVKLNEKIGSKKVYNLAASLGLTASLEDDFTGKSNDLTYGNVTVSAVEVASIYAAFAADGVYCQPKVIVSVVDMNEKILPIPTTSCKEILRPSVAGTITSLLQSNLNGGLSSSGKLSDGRPAAGIGGVTNDKTSVWFAGYTPQMSTALLVSTPVDVSKKVENLEIFQQKFSNVSGNNVPAILWSRFMSQASGSFPVTGFTPGGGDTYVGLALLVPNVKGYKSADAINILEKAGFKVEVVVSDKKDERFASGVVIAQSPKAGEVMDASSKTAYIKLNP